MLQKRYNRQLQIPKSPKIYLELKMSGSVIPCVKTQKHLGLTFSTDLRFHEHVNSILKNVSKSLTSIYPIARHVPKHTTKFYKIYIRPLFDYADAVYDNHITISYSIRLEDCKTGQLS